MENWRTTTLAVLSALALIFGQVHDLLDDNPKTVFNLDIVLGALGVLGIGVFARDKQTGGPQ